MTHIRSLRGWLTAGVALLTLSACAVGPRAPDPVLPTSGLDALVSSDAAVSSGAASLAPVQADWWRLYKDPVLDGLIQSALAENNQLESALANLRAVRATLSEARAGRLPTTTTTGSYSYGRQSAAGFNIPGIPSRNDPADETETYDVGLDVAYEVDLFGRVSSTIRAARADADATAEATETVRITVVAETARAYADLCSANAQIVVAERTLDLQSRTADLTQRLLEGGAGTGLDTARAQTAVQSTRASLPPLRSVRDGAAFRLATLIGVTPSQVPADVRTCASPPTLTQPIPVGDGQALLSRRPDVRQAERQLAAAAARVNVATASLYPSISLGGSLGSTAMNAGDLGDEAAFRFSVGPLIRWSFPNIAVARAQIARSSALSEAALADFDQTVLAALEETETALTSYANELDRRTALMAARDQAARAARLSRLRFDAGADSFLTVLDAERTLASTEATLAQSQAQVSTNQILLFKALAGGWSETTPAS